MKTNKIILAGFSLIILFLSQSCETHEDGMNALASEQHKDLYDPYYVPFEMALAEVENLFAQGQTTRSLNQTTRKVDNHHEFVFNKGTRAIGNDSIDVRFHIINFADNQGFALVSADSRTTGIYAYSETGNLDIEDAIENTGFGDFMESAAKHYENEIDISKNNTRGGSIGPLPPDPNGITKLNMEEWNGVMYYVDHQTMIAYTYEPLLQVKWHQLSPYNYYCPEITTNSWYLDGKAATGCGPIAVAQIMSYYQYPSIVLSTHFDWESIMTAPSYTYFDYSNASLATAYLIHKVGESSHAVYGEQTSTYLIDDATTLFLCGYGYSGPESFSESKVRSSIASHYPVLMSGRQNGNGHAWVIDGYRQNKMVSTYYYKTPPYNVFRVQTDMLGYYYHCNWGWTTPNTWCISTFDGWNSDKQLVYNIRPRTND